jgi:hypothetical protein
VAAPGPAVGVVTLPAPVLGTIVVTLVRDDAVGDAADGAGVGTDGVAVTVAPPKLTVLWWQLPHGAAVTTWLFGLPRARVLL